VEYSTFDDKVYKLKDLTVMSYLRLAHRLAKDPKGKSNSVAGSDDSLAENLDFEEDEDDDVESQKGGKHKDKDNTKGKKKKKKKHNKAWIEFLHRAFVGTVKKKDLKKM
jgi:endopolyphosphatase